MLKLIVSFLCLCACYACRSNLASTDGARHNAVSNSVVKDSSAIDSDSEWDDDDSLFAPIRISSKYLKFHPLSFPLNTSPDSMLRGLIPGKYYYAGNFDTIHMVAWTCRRPYKTSNSGNEGMDDPFDFPDDSFNQTRLNASYQFKSSEGADYLVLMLTTSNHNEEMITGRFSCGYLGVAIFQKKESMWQLKSFNPAIDCIGQFGNAPVPEFLQAKNDTILMYIREFTGSWDHYDLNLNVLRITKGNWEIFPVQSNAGFGDFDRDKASEIFYSPEHIYLGSPSQTMPQCFYVSTKGFAKSPSKIDTGDWPVNIFPNQLVTDILNSKKDSIHFEFRSVYHFGNNNYDLLKQDSLKMEAFSK